MTQIAIEIRHVHEFFGGDLRPVLDFVRLAEQKGVDQVAMAEHVALSQSAPANYPGQKFPPLDYDWHEPIALLSAIAAVTTRIRLSTGILISPLRPAVLLAKQLATLDRLSQGRVDIGFGAGWHREEFAACGVPFEGRFRRMEEQILACRALWRDAPASFHGDTVSFDGLYCYPRPVQPNGIPIWLGLSATERAFQRLAEFADGWVRLEPDPQLLKRYIAAVRAALAARGRDPAAFKVRAQVPHALDPDGKPDLEATLARAPAYVDAGADILEFYPGRICTRADQLEPFLDAILKLKG